MSPVKGRAKKAMSRLRNAPPRTPQTMPYSGPTFLAASMSAPPSRSSVASGGFLSASGSALDLYRKSGDNPRSVAVSAADWSAGESGSPPSEGTRAAAALAFCSLAMVASAAPHLVAPDVLKPSCLPNPTSAALRTADPLGSSADTLEPALPLNSSSAAREESKPSSDESSSDSCGRGRGGCDGRAQWGGKATMAGGCPLAAPMPLRTSGGSSNLAFFSAASQHGSRSRSPLQLAMSADDAEMVAAVSGTAAGAVFALATAIVAPPRERSMLATSGARGPATSADPRSRAMEGLMSVVSSIADIGRAGESGAGARRQAGDLAIAARQKWSDFFLFFYSETGRGWAEGLGE
eukprot:scaffold16545_cov121-Isochrysis_galbana.AAC.2